MTDAASSSVTIVLCTCDRPGMLRDALASVRRQTARQAIARIVVSENGRNPGSGAVCREFADLPIEYLLQDPPVPPLRHWPAMWPRVESPLVAILHDDDWWAPCHLESALAALQANPGCAAFYSSFLESYRPRGWGWWNYSYLTAWLAVGGDFSQPLALVDPPGVMLACLLCPSFHYSTLVGRTEAIWDACQRNLARDNAFDNDRTFPMFLSRFGAIAYQNLPDVFVRQHAFRHAWSREFFGRQHLQTVQETTRWLLKTYPQEVAEAAARFRRLAAELSPREAEQLWEALQACIRGPQWATLSGECGVELAAVQQRLPKGILPGWVKRFGAAFCPPILWQTALRLPMLARWEQHFQRWQREFPEVKQESPHSTSGTAAGRPSP